MLYHTGICIISCRASLASKDLLLPSSLDQPIIWLEWWSLNHSIDTSRVLRPMPISLVNTPTAFTRSFPCTHMSHIWITKLAEIIIAFATLSCVSKVDFYILCTNSYHNHRYTHTRQNTSHKWLHCMHRTSWFSWHDHIHISHTTKLPSTFWVWTCF